MTTTFTERTEALEQVLLSGPRAAHLGREIVPVVRPTRPSSHWVATAVLPADHAVGWAIEDWRIRQCEALRPFAGMKGWHLAEGDVEGTERAAQDVADVAVSGTTDRDTYLAEVPAEYRSLIPARARWATLNRAVDVYGTPGRYLAMPSESSESHVLVAWPGHERYDLFGDRTRHGVPTPLKGWIIGNPDRDLTYEPEPVAATTERFADVPAEYRHLMPAEAVRITYDSGMWGETSYYYAIDGAPSHPDHYILIMWPGHPRHVHGGDRPGIIHPLRGWYARKSNCEVITEPEVEDRLAEVPQEYRHLIPEDARWGVMTERQDTHAMPGERYLAIPRSEMSDEGWVTIIAWRGHEKYDYFGPRRRAGIDEPLHGYTVRDRRFRYDETTTPEQETVEASLPLQVGDRVVQVGPHTMGGSGVEYHESNGVGSRGELIGTGSGAGDFSIRWDEGGTSVIHESGLQRESEYDAAQSAAGVAEAPVPATVPDEVLASLREAVQALRDAGQAATAQRLMSHHPDLFPVQRWTVTANLGSGLTVTREVETPQGTDWRDARRQMRESLRDNPVRLDEIVMPDEGVDADMPSVGHHNVERVEG